MIKRKRRAQILVTFVMVLPMSVGLAKDSFVGLSGQVYLEMTEIKCLVAKAVPDPSSGANWYRSSSIGDLWMTAEPTTVIDTFSGNAAALGRITFYRSERFREEVLVYRNAWWKVVDEVVRGNGDVTVPVDPKKKGVPLSFNINKVEQQGLFNGKDGDPQYFLKNCEFTPKLVLLSESDQQKVLSINERQKGAGGGAASK